MEEEIKNEEETGQSKVSQWIQDNMRVIISVLIVILIASGVYFYSKRTEAPVITTDETTQEEIALEEMIDGETATEEAGTTVVEEKKDGSVSTSAPVATSQETETTFVETAGRGDSATVLARRALANYLEKNPDSALTPEHKIYIEDYLRKNVSYGRIYVGTSMEFSKSLIQDAIAKSKTLNEAQLNNLHKYAVRVPSLS